MTATAPSDSKRRWLILALIGLAQLMVVLDVTIVNIALPSAQKALGFSNDARQWIVTAYALSFGSLLLLGGRLGDLIGRKRVFVAGLAGFAAASAAASRPRPPSGTSTSPVRSPHRPAWSLSCTACPTLRRTAGARR